MRPASAARGSGEAARGGGARRCRSLSLPSSVAVRCWGPLVTNWRELGWPGPRGPGLRGSSWAPGQLLAGCRSLSPGAVPCARRAVQRLCPGSGSADALGNSPDEAMAGGGKAAGLAGREHRRGQGWKGKALIWGLLCSRRPFLQRKVPGSGCCGKVSQEHHLGRCPEQCWGTPGCRVPIVCLSPPPLFLCPAFVCPLSPSQGKSSVLGLSPCHPLALGEGEALWPPALFPSQTQVLSFPRAVPVPGAGAAALGWTRELGGQELLELNLWRKKKLL